MSVFRSREDSPRSRSYATCADFCENFARDLQPLYRLALLLMGTPTEADQCLAVTIEDCVNARSVFKGWERSWTRRCLVINAIRHVFSQQSESRWKTDLSRQIDPELGKITAIRLAPPLLRFVFVMSVLEKYPMYDCALLLGCTQRDVVEARINILRQLTDFDLTLTQTTQQRMQAMVVA